MTLLRVGIVLVLLLSSACARLAQDEHSKRGIIIYPPIYYNQNATSVYSTDTEKCCRGRVTFVGHQSNARCCGSDSYDPSRELCCANTVQPFTVGQACCGQQTYDTQQALCCNDQVHQVSSSRDRPYFDCCGVDEVIDTRTNLCCYDMSTNQMASTRKTNGNDDQCCGNQTYNSASEICCSVYQEELLTYRVLPSEGGRSQCCGLQAYDPQSQSCCGDRVSAGSNMGCCNNNQTYDMSKATCCWNANPAVLVPIDDPAENSCCGNNPYNPIKQLCCGEKVSDNAEGRKQCCNNTVIDTREELCCYGNDQLQRVKKQSDNDDQCCGLDPYSTTDDMCCYRNGDYKVTRGIPSSCGVCCGGEAHDNRKGQCCSIDYQTERWNEGRPANGGCCGLTTYDYITSVCCNQTVYDVNGNQQCCGDSLIDPTRQTCCYDSPTGSAYAIDEVQQGTMCCGGKLVDYSRGCCQGTAYDTTTHVCCGAIVVAKNSPDQYNCCYDYLTDDSTCYNSYPYPGGPIIRDEVEEKKKRKRR